jgi:hypothetical protein
LDGKIAYKNTKVDPVSSAAVQVYGRTVRALRRFTQASLNKEPDGRRP